MIVIVSEEIDQPTSMVIRWIEYYGKQWIRINYVDFIVEKRVGFIQTEQESGILYDGKKISLNDIVGVWFRRKPKFRSLKNLTENLENPELKKLNDSILEFKYSELNEHFNFFLKFLKCHPNALGDPFVTSINKLDQLRIAKTIGLDIPDTLVTSDYNALIEFIRHRNCIVKPINNIKTFSFQNKFFTSFTKQINIHDLNQLELDVPLSIQEKIDKDYEIRIFVLKETFYSIAIFDHSGGDDYRKNQKEIQITQYQIPDYMKFQILKLIQCFGLNTCSVDLIKGKNGKYYFLEINPVGQFGFVSYPCNYNIEKDIAQVLCKIK